MLHETVKFFYFSFLTEKPDDLFLRGGKKGKISTKLYYKYKKTAPHLFGTGPLILHLKVLPCVLADRVVCLLADVVLDLAGVLLRHLGVHPQSDEEAGQSVVPVQHTGGNGHA